MKPDNPRRTVLIIDDDELFCDAVRDYLDGGRMQVVTALNGAEGVEALRNHRVDVVVLDQNLPDVQGHTLCPEILKNDDRTKIVFITAQPSFDVAVKALRAGAHDYLSKPFELEELTLAIEKAFKTSELERSAQIGKYRSLRESEETVLVGSSSGLKEVSRLVELAASVNAPVLITGETGTGKSVVASAIHYKSSARKEAFISINCAALPENLIEAELFGYEKGAFTGATMTKKGIFEMAEGGTLFLDEIGEMPAHLQTKLLGALESKKIKRLGGDAIRPVDVRVIAATAVDLEEAGERTFRSDLYYRLSVVRIHIPPLRDRRKDITELCDYFLARSFSGFYSKLADSEIEKLMEYEWPGNVRELRNILERAAILQQGPALRPSELLGSPYSTQPPVCSPPTETDDRSLEEVEKSHIHQVLKRHNGNYTRAAKTLGIALSTLKRKIKAYGLR